MISSHTIGSGNGTLTVRYGDSLSARIAIEVENGGKTLKVDLTVEDLLHLIDKLNRELRHRLTGKESANAPAEVAYSAFDEPVRRTGK